MFEVKHSTKVLHEVKICFAYIAPQKPYNIDIILDFRKFCVIRPKNCFDKKIVLSKKNKLLTNTGMLVNQEPSLGSMLEIKSIPPSRFYFLFIFLVNVDKKEKVNLFCMYYSQPRTNILVNRRYNPYWNINRTGVDGSVLQTPSLLIESCFLKHTL